MKPPIIDQTSYIVAAVILVVSLVLFFIDSGEFFQSLFAAILAGALAWFTYVLLKIIYYTFKK